MRRDLDVEPRGSKRATYGRLTVVDHASLQGVSSAGATPRALAVTYRGADMNAAKASEVR